MRFVGKDGLTDMTDVIQFNLLLSVQIKEIANKLQGIFDYA